MEENGASTLKDVATSIEGDDVQPSSSSATTEQCNVPLSQVPLSQDELDQFLSSTVTDPSSIDDQENLAPHDPTPPVPSKVSGNVAESICVDGLADMRELSISDSCRPPRASPTHDCLNEDEEQEYILKEIFYDGGIRKIMTQNLNGPCPLIAVVNALVLQGRFSFGHNEFKVTLTRVLDAVAEKILVEKDRRKDSQETVDANVEAALLTLRKCSKGLDVNVRFGRPDDFEFTQSDALFDILELKLLHGWIADEGTLSVISNRAYNEITAYITEDSNEARLIKEWLELNRTQLTFEGIEKLKDNLRNGSVAVMFRNNHFTTITKYDDTLFILLTDMGFIALEALVFESLVDINQRSSVFTNGRFEQVNADGSVSENRRALIAPPVQDISQDDDRALAVALQEEEHRLERERRETEAREMRARNEERSRHSQQERAEYSQSKKKNGCSVM